ncbi:MAG: hypothetical protein ACLR8P_09435 [Clostridium fessum]
MRIELPVDELGVKALDELYSQTHAREVRPDCFVSMAAVSFAFVPVR